MRTPLHAFAAICAIATLSVTGPSTAAPVPQLSVNPQSGPGGTTVTATGTNFCAAPCSPVGIAFGGQPVKIAVTVAADGTFHTTFTVPTTALGGVNIVYASQTTASGGMQQANTRFTVTPSEPPPGSSTATPHTPTPPATSHPRSSSPAHTASATSSATSTKATGTPATPSSTSTTTASTTGSPTPSASASTSPSQQPSEAVSTPTANSSRHQGFPLWAIIAIAAAAVLALAAVTWRFARGR